ncbi:MAG: hypothetical protein LBS71_00095 [Puniceicoccales bacterium]|nr:hypothetical protein [Puniceicoccales bacterium]
MLPKLIQLLKNFSEILEDRFSEISLRVFFIIGFIYIGWEYFGAISDIAFTGTYFFFAVVGKPMSNWADIITRATGRVCEFCIASSVLKMLLTITYNIRFRCIGYILSILPPMGVFVSIPALLSFRLFIGAKLFIGALFIIFMIANVIFVPILDWHSFMVYRKSVNKQDN